MGYVQVEQAFVHFLPKYLVHTLDIIFFYVFWQDLTFLKDSTAFVYGLQGL